MSEGRRMERSRLDMGVERMPKVPVSEEEGEGVEVEVDEG